MTARTILGVDPGQTGALALLDTDGELVDVWDMPTVDRQVSAALLGDLVAAIWNHVIHHDLTAVVEQVHAMPRQGVSTTFKFGVSYGVVLGVVGALDIPVAHVTPAVWKKAMHVTADKGSSRRRAIDLWPGKASVFARVKDDGRAEAALIARYHWEVKV